MARNRKVWNDDLVRAMECRYNKDHADGKQSQFGWKQARDIIRSQRKDIYQVQSGNRDIKNLPEKLTKTMKATCEAIIRNEKPIILPGLPNNLNPLSPGYAGPVNNHADLVEHPYLNKMHYRGGGYAILMAFHRTGKNMMFISEIIKIAKHYCDGPMDTNFHAGITHGHGWDSIKSLITHNLIIRSGGLHSRQAGQRDTFTLTAEGKDFIPKMIAKYSATNQTGITNNPAIATPTHHQSSIQREIERNRNMDSNDSWRAFPSPVLIDPMKKNPNANNLKDIDKLINWILENKSLEKIRPIRNSSISFEVGKNRRKYLHDMIEYRMGNMGGFRLKHESVGHGRGRTLVVSIIDTDDQQTMSKQVLSPPSSNTSNLSNDDGIRSKRSKRSMSSIVDVESDDDDSDDISNIATPLFPPTSAGHYAANPTTQTPQVSAREAAKQAALKRLSAHQASVKKHERIRAEPISQSSYSAPPRSSSSSSSSMSSMLVDVRDHEEEDMGVVKMQSLGSPDNRHEVDDDDEEEEEARQLKRAMEESIKSLSSYRSSTSSSSSSSSSSNPFISDIPTISVEAQCLALINDILNSDQKEAEEETPNPPTPTYADQEEENDLELARAISESMRTNQPLPPEIDQSKDDDDDDNDGDDDDEDEKELQKGLKMSLEDTPRSPPPPSSPSSTFLMTTLSPGGIARADTLPLPQDSDVLNNDHMELGDDSKDSIQDIITPKKKEVNSSCLTPSFNVDDDDEDEVVIVEEVKRHLSAGYCDDQEQGVNKNDEDDQEEEDSLIDLVESSSSNNSFEGHPQHEHIEVIDDSQQDEADYREIDLC